MNQESIGLPRFSNVERERKIPTANFCLWGARKKEKSRLVSPFCSLNVCFAIPRACEGLCYLGHHRTGSVKHST